MHNTFRLLSWLLLCLLLHSGPATFAEEAAPSLFSNDNVKLRTQALPAQRSAELARLTDDDPATTVALSVTDEKPVDLVVEFGAEITAPVALIIALPDRGGAAPQRVEALSSVLSADAGFQSLRVFQIAATKEPQRFELPPSAARWLRLRFVPGRGAKQVELAEIDVRGTIGPPKSEYRFKESPAKVLSVLSTLEESAALSEEEQSMLRDGADGRFDTWDLADAALLASGVAGKETRRKHREQLSERLEQFRSGKPDDDAFAQGDALLRFLHRQTLRGYVEKQTDVSTLLETGQFNCVSATLTYMILGRSQGLDVRAVEAPDHVFAILYDGVRHVDVETTNQWGFNPSVSREARRRLREQTGFDYIAQQRADQRRELPPPGAVAVIYYNHGVSLTKAGKFNEALGAYFRALSLDREFVSAIKNTLVVFARWSGALLDSGDYEKALQVIHAGLHLAPEDAALLAYRKAVWITYVKTLHEAGKRKEAVAVLQRAAKDDPQGDYAEMQSWVYISAGQEQAEQQQWPAAWRIAEEAIQAVDSSAREETERWRTSLLLSWSYHALEAKDYAVAARVSALGVELRPDDKRFQERLAYITQEWMWSVYQEKGALAALTVGEQLVAANPETQGVGRAASSFVSRASRDLVENQSFRDAASLAQRSEKLTGAAESTRLFNYVFDSWSTHLLSKQQYAAAVDIYRQAITAQPQNQHLRSNQQAVWDQWAKSLADKNAPAAAAGVYAKAIAAAPEDQRLRKNFAYYVLKAAETTAQEAGRQRAGEQYFIASLKQYPQMKELQEGAQYFVESQARRMVDAKQFEKAARMLARTADLQSDSDRILPLVRYTADRWAEQLFANQQYEKSTAAYQLALESFPEDKHLRRNASIAWDRWARSYFPQKDWKAAATVYEQGVKLFPESKSLIAGWDYVKDRLAQ